MNDAAPNPAESRADALVASYERAGYARVAPAILQPAEPFLDLSGEDIRRRMYLTTDAGGRELCLRPDFTIAVSRDYLASPAAGSPAGFCYLGPIFRQQDGGFGEVLQAGIESFGRRDVAAADAEIFALGLEATSLYGVTAPDIRMGDVGLFIALVEALDIAPAWKRRLIKDFHRSGRLQRDLDLLMRDADRTRSEYAGVLAALTNSDPAAAHALVTDLLSIAGITAVGGRTVGEIADRFLEQATLGAGNGLPQDVRALIERFLAVAGDPDSAVADLRRLATDSGLVIEPALDLFESRTGFLAARGVDVHRIRFSTTFSTSLDYYTGFEFRLHDPKGGDEPLVAGGRYDNLLTRLGSASPIPAVGLGVFIERLTALGGRPCQHWSSPFRPRAACRKTPTLSSRRPDSSWSSRAGCATIAAPSTISMASRSPISRPPRSPSSSRRVRCTSASPARISCAR
jgi:ATP phosphoribosyltransferase regulatory subunit